MNKRKFAKLKREEFHEALRELLLTMEEFADKADTNQSYLSRISSSSPSSCRCGKKYARRVLDALNELHGIERYVFDDLFFWV